MAVAPWCGPAAGGGDRDGPRKVRLTRSAGAGNDAGGVATYASVGAAYGYGLLWVLIPLLIGLVVIQEMCARMGAVTQKGLADLIREEFGVRWTAGEPPPEA